MRTATAVRSSCRTRFLVLFPLLPLLHERRHSSSYRGELMNVGTCGIDGLLLVLELLLDVDLVNADLV